MHIRPFIRRYRSELLIGAGFGIAIACSLKYLAAIYLILWVLTGSQ